MSLRQSYCSNSSGDPPQRGSGLLVWLAGGGSNSCARGGAPVLQSLRAGPASTQTPDCPVPPNWLRWWRARTLGELPSQAFSHNSCSRFLSVFPVEGVALRRGCIWFCFTNARAFWSQGDSHIHVAPRRAGVVSILLTFGSYKPAPESGTEWMTQGTL